VYHSEAVSVNLWHTTLVTWTALLMGKPHLWLLNWSNSWSI